MVLAVVLGWPAGIRAAAQPEDSVVWHGESNRLDARIESCNLEQLLARVAAATGWQIYLEPETTRRITAKFQDLEIGPALARLLGDLNYALLPQTQAPAKLFVFRTSVQEAVQWVKPLKATRPKTSGLIPNELIVTLKPGAKQNINDLARRLGAKVMGRAEGRNAYRLQFTDETAANIARGAFQGNPEVSSVDSNYLMAQPTRTDPLSLSSPLALNLKPSQTPDPHRLVIGLVDSAVQPEGAKIKDFLLPGVALAGDVQPSATVPSHGTSMAETILRGIAIGAPGGQETSTRILPVDVYGNNDGTTTFDVANGIAVAVKKGATLINLSLSGDGDSPYLHGVIQAAHQQGVIFVAAAGNEPTTAPTYPAAYPEVVAATAGDRRGNIAPYASRGSFVSVIAPGGNIITFDNQSYLISGTSAATAYVSGLAAGLAASSGKPLNDAMTEIRQTLGVRPAPKP